MRQITHVSRYVCTPHKMFVILQRGNSLIFFQNYFCNNSIYIRRVCKCMVDVRSASRGVRQDHAHFLFIKENGWIFFHDSFCIEQTVVQNIFEIFIEHARPPLRSWQGHTNFLFRKLLLENGWIFFHNSFASSRLWSKIFLKIFSSMVSHLKERGRTTPIFCWNVIAGKRLNIFA